VEEYADKSQGDRISCAKLRHYLTYPSILQNRCAAPRRRLG